MECKHGNERNCIDCILEARENNPLPVISMSGDFSLAYDPETKEFETFKKGEAVMPRYIAKAYINEKLKKVVIAAQNKLDAECKAPGKLAKTHNCKEEDVKHITITKL